MSGIDKEVLRKENSYLKSTITCRRCNIVQVQTLFLPCRHLVSCEKCSTTMDDYILCGQKNYRNSQSISNLNIVWWPGGSRSTAVIGLRTGGGVGYSTRRGVDGDRTPDRQLGRRARRRRWRSVKIYF